MCRGEHAIASCSTSSPLELMLILTIAGMDVVILTDLTHKQESIDGASLFPTLRFPLRNVASLRP